MVWKTQQMKGKKNAITKKNKINRNFMEYIFFNHIHVQLIVDNNYMHVL